ncbi:MAG: flagellar filament capping protein FliD [Synergistaceae bacterium]|nr:flagellar filament capping protein FliD [Synergistaceae bacterium]
MASSTMSVSGVVSGMDWESMIDTIIEKAAKPAQVQVNKRTNLQNKKSLFEEMKVTMNSIQSSLSPLKLPSTYKAKDIEIERIDSTGSYKGVLTATVNADAEVNVYDLEVKQLARAQTNRSSQITASTLKSTLGSLEASKLYINAGNQKIGIDVYNNDSLESLKSRINTTLKTLSIPVGVTASVVDSRLILKSDSTGLGTTSVSGTASQRYNSSGHTDLSTIITDADSGQSVNIVVDDSNVENVKISSGSKSYSIHKDYEIVNNQIRWKQYEDTETVKLGESISASYTMGKGDVYSKTVKRGSDDTDSVSFDFDLIDKGTLSKRMTIKGKKTTTETETETKYSLDDDEEVGTTTTTETTEDDDGNEIVTKTTVKISEVDDDTGNYFTVETTVATTKFTNFVYGKDFTYSDGKITWLEQEGETTTTNEPSSYTIKYTKDTSVDYEIDGGKDNDFVEDTYTTEPDSYSVKIVNTNSWTYSAPKVTKSTALSSGVTDAIELDFDALSVEYAKATGETLKTKKLEGVNNVTYLDPADDYLSCFNITANGTTYEYGKDFVIRLDGTTEVVDTSKWRITWGSSSGTSDVQSDPTLNAVKYYAQYKGITGEVKAYPSIGTAMEFGFEYSYEETLSGKVNKGDNDKRLETVFGTEIDSEYYDRLEIYGYEYGTDYTVEEDENGYAVIKWLEQTDVSTSNTDDDEFFNFDADEFTAAYKNATGEDTLPTITITGSDGVIRTYVDPTDRSLFKLTDDNGNEYEYGRDYVFRVKDDGDGYVLSWFAADDRTGDDIIDANDANIAVTAYAEAKNISTLNFKASPDAGEGFTFSIKVDQTKEYSAGVKSDDEDKDLSLASLFGNLTAEELEELEDNGYSVLTIEDADGNTYTYVETEDDLDEDSFTIVDGEIVWYTQTIEGSDYEPNAPAANTEYTIYYESFAGVQSTNESDGEDETELKIFSDDGKLSNSSNASYLSYEQILKDAGSKLTTSSTQSEVDEVLKKYFSITDELGDSYAYGTDFIIKMGGEDSDSGQHKAVIEWMSAAPSYGDEYTISYTGRGTGGGEVVKIEDAVTRSNSDVVYSGTSGSPVYSEFQSGTTTITQGTKTFFEGYDFEVAKDDDDNVVINWKTGTDWEWYYPTSGQYTINLTTEDGTSKTFTAYRGTRDTLDLKDFGFETVGNNGTLNSITYDGTTYDLTSTSTDDDGKTPSDLVKEKLGINLAAGTNGVSRTYNFDWITPARTNREGLPGIGDEIEVEYEYNTNTFTLSDDGDGLVDLLGLNSDVTEAQNAILVLDGEEVERDLNNIGESYGNELIKGMTINLKGVGEVSMDVSHDAEKAVTSIQTFVENYNSLMSWMNTRMTESEVDKDTAATVDSDDFRMRWGLLHGNSLLRNTKSQMRDTVAQNFTFSFTSRKSSEEVYGAMSFNGLKNDSTLRLRINSTYVDVPILMTDTLQDIVDKISDSSNPAMRNIYYGDDGQLLDDSLIKAKIEGDKLVISSSSNAEITMSGTAAMNALKMNYTYKGVYQLGIATTSDDYGKSGELEFDTDKFMEALEENPDEVQDLMLKFASSMDTWTKSMLNSSASGATSGTLTRQIEDIDTQIKSIDEYLEKYQDRLDRMEESLRTKYAAAEQQISKLSQQASAISAILQQLTSSGSNSNSSSS